MWPIKSMAEMNETSEERAMTAVRRLILSGRAHTILLMYLNMGLTLDEDSLLWAVQSDYEYMVRVVVFIQTGKHDILRKGKFGLVTGVRALLGNLLKPEKEIFEIATSGKCDPYIIRILSDIGMDFGSKDKLTALTDHLSEFNEWNFLTKKHGSSLSDKLKDAISNRKMDTIERLVAAIPFINSVIDKRSVRLIIEKNLTDILALLLKNGLDPNLPCLVKSPCLRYAIGASASLKCMKMLIDAGANIYDDDLMHVAYIENNEQAVDLLLTYGVYSDRVPDEHRGSLRNMVKRNVILGMHSRSGESSVYRAFVQGNSDERHVLGLVFGFIGCSWEWKVSNEAVRFMRYGLRSIESNQ